MQKKEAIDIIVKCAELYKENLEGKNLLFFFKSKDGIGQFEAAFLAKNFLHLTGAILNKNKLKSANDFYKTCIDHELGSDYFRLPTTTMAEMKLSILTQMVNIHKSAKMIGDYDFNKPRLFTERLAGNVFGCMGFIKVKGFYIPNTVIKEDIRDITHRPQSRVLAILRKDIKAPMYKEITYLAKGDSIELQFLRKNIEKDIGLDKRKSLDEQLAEIRQQANNQGDKASKKNIKRDRPIR